MSRTGAKRKPRGYMPGRQNMHTLADDEFAAQHPHRAGLPDGTRLSAKAVTVLGRLNLTGKLTEAQYQAGERYRSVVAQYCSSIGVPASGRTMEGKDYPCTGSLVCHPCECRRIKERYDEAFEAVINVSQRAAKAVAHVAVYDKGCPYGDMQYLISGLNALAHHFGIDTQDRVLQTRNVQ